MPYLMLNLGPNPLHLSSTLSLALAMVLSKTLFSLESQPNAIPVPLRDHNFLTVHLVLKILLQPYRKQVRDGECLCGVWVDISNMP